MAYLYRRKKDGRLEIREAVATPRGPRSRTLVGFRGPLRPDHLERAEARARRPFDRDAIVRRARDLRVEVGADRADDLARELLARLRRGDAIDPRLVTLLRAELAARPARPIDEELRDAAEWVGASDVERGRALRDVLRLYDAIGRSREPVRAAPLERFPHFASRPSRAAS